jgi:pyruvate dehydrogenase complex dehydrogenase (E1) component
MYFDEFKHQLPDIDEAETQDWVDSFDQVLDQEGEHRARFLMYKLLKRARQRHVGLPSLTRPATSTRSAPSRSRGSRATRSWSAASAG